MGDPVISILEITALEEIGGKPATGIQE